MSDLIDRGAAVVAVKCGALSARTIYGRTDEGMAALKATVTAIRELPAVDAVEVVRCKDCKHFHYDMPYVIQGIPVLVHEICTFWGDGCKTSENEFCSHAERRQDD